MKLTRRQLAAVALVAVPAPVSASPQAEDLDTAARDRMKANAAALQPVAVPMATEPAVVFKAL